jgi:hypothetical protein
VEADGALMAMTHAAVQQSVAIFKEIQEATRAEAEAVAMAGAG